MLGSQPWRMESSSCRAGVATQQAKYPFHCQSASTPTCRDPPLLERGELGHRNNQPLASLLRLPTREPAEGWFETGLGPALPPSSLHMGNQTAGELKYCTQEAQSFGQPVGIVSHLGSSSVPSPCWLSPRLNRLSHSNPVGSGRVSLFLCPLSSCWVSLLTVNSQGQGTAVTSPPDQRDSSSWLRLRSGLQ